MGSELSTVVADDVPDVVITGHPEADVETRHAVMLLQETRQRVGYLLKDRVSDIGDFVEAVQRIALGGSAIDPGVVAQLLGHRANEDSLAKAGTDGRR